MLAPLCSATGCNSKTSRMNELDRIIERLQMRLPRPDGAEQESGDRVQAAVAVLLREEAGEPQILVIQRACNPRDHWSGHLALPGGRRDPEDEDLVATAAREVQEEVGIEIRSREDFLARLRPVAPSNPRLPRISITPFIALAPPAVTLQLNTEVKSAFWVGAKALKEAGRSDQVKMVIDGVDYRWPAYPTECGPIWGITESILTEFLGYLD